MLGDRRVALADHARAGEDRADVRHLLVGQAMDLLQLPEQPLVLLLEGARRRGKRGPMSDVASRG